MSRVKIFTVASVPTGLAKAWLQHLRDFDTAHPGCHFELAADTPDITMAEVLELLQLDPPLDLQAIFDRKPKS